MQCWGAWRESRERSSAVGKQGRWSCWRQRENRRECICSLEYIRPLTSVFKHPAFVLVTVMQFTGWYLNNLMVILFLHFAMLFNGVMLNNGKALLILIWPETITNVKINIFHIHYASLSFRIMETVEVQWWCKCGILEAIKRKNSKYITHSVKHGHTCVQQSAQANVPCLISVQK